MLGSSVTGLGTGFGGKLMVNVTGLELPPPAGGVKTVTEAVPAVAKSAAVICAVSCVLFTKFVARGLPFQRTTESATKFAPFTVMVRPLVPACASLGVIVVMRGTGRSACLISNVTAFDTPPPGGGLNTVTEAVPMLAMSAAVICADNSVTPINAVTRS